MNERKTSKGPGRSGWVHFVATIFCILTAWHILASFLWIAPYSANAREIVPGKALSNYMLPLFGQAWSVFAPLPVNADWHFEVRVKKISDDGQLETTDWVSATDVELSMLLRTLAPPRAAIQSTILSSDLRGAYRKLSDAEKEIATSDYGTREELNEALREIALLGNDSKSDESHMSPEAQNFVAQDSRATAYATQVAYAVWGPDVTSVKYRVIRQEVIPFAQRNNPEALPPEPYILHIGWHDPIIDPSQNEEAFQKIFKAQYERIQAK